MKKRKVCRDKSTILGVTSPDPGPCVARPWDRKTHDIGEGSRRVEKTADKHQHNGVAGPVFYLHDKVLIEDILPNLPSQSCKRCDHEIHRSALRFAEMPDI